MDMHGKLNGMSQGDVLPESKAKDELDILNETAARKAEEASLTDNNYILDAIIKTHPSNFLSKDAIASLNKFESSNDYKSQDVKPMKFKLPDETSTDAEDSSENSLKFEHPYYCTNCTYEYSDIQVHCPACGHSKFKDDDLFCATSKNHLLNDKMKTILMYDDRLLDHSEGKVLPHPERPDRIRAVISRLMRSGLAEQCLQSACREATQDELLTCHTSEYIRELRKKVDEAFILNENLGVPLTYFTSDTYVHTSTFQCASLAAGASASVAASVARGKARNGAAVIRPPGHHAESSMAMGFCFFNNAAIAARSAQKAGAEKILILDWDVHHGNGTQHIVEDDPSILYMSIHRHDSGQFFPGTGDATEVGHREGVGKTVNIPWPLGGMGDPDYLAAFNHIVLPIAYEFAPDLIIVSAGYDASLGDPLGGCMLTPNGYAHMTALLMPVAPLVVLLEGGYNLEATASGVEATLKTLLGELPPSLSLQSSPSIFAASTIMNVIKIQAQYWNCFKAVTNQARQCLSFSNSDVEDYKHNDHEFSNHQLKDFEDFSDCKYQGDSSTRWQGKHHTYPRLQGRNERRYRYLHALHIVALRCRMKKAKCK